MNHIYRRWTNLSRNCYNRGCMCNTCHEYPICSKYGYEMKRSVLKLVSVLGRPEVEQGDCFGCSSKEVMNLAKKKGKGC